MPGSFAVFALHSYVAAEAYAQAGGVSASSHSLFSAAASETLDAVPFTRPPASVFFAPGPSPECASESSPYRSSLLIRFPQATLPQPVVDYLINQSFLTGLYYSLFRHGPASDPEAYEVREGSPTECDRSILGGERFDPQEESFFGISWVAHVHPPRQSPLPSDADLDALAERARISSSRHARHVLFGFHHGEPVSVDLRALWDPVFRSAYLLHRASPEIALEADLRIQEWLAV
ncbi:MAG TPA: hypothetical protein VFX30_08455 [bacterium]|nr:hypothetical protein [bacterium]